VIAKQQGKSRYITTIGVSSDDAELEELCEKGQAWIRKQNLLPDMFDTCELEKTERESVEHFFIVFFHKNLLRLFLWQM
ncbi:MAG: hypothetical protein LBT78_05655, partial [Tannerella sp.]|nr:hypothetical protein [Tannerella sp.]